MSTSTTLAGYLGILALTFAAAFGIGTVTGNPFDSPTAPHPPHVSDQGDPDPGHGGHGH